jgi:MipA family protein
MTFLVHRVLSLSTSGLLTAALLLGKSALAQTPSDTWKFSVGAGAISQPRYPGSSERKTEAIPLVSANYGRYFIGGAPGAGVPAGIGAFIVMEPNWKLGVGIGGNLGKPREESDSPRLRGLGDIDRTVLGSVFGSYDDKWFSVKAGVLTDIGGKDQGTRVSLDLEGKYSVTEELTLSAGPGLTWADSKYTQTFFGISPAQSANSGLGVYTARSGLNTLRFGVGADYRLTANWGLGARITAASLRGDVADSPITERKSQNSFALFAAYRF